MGESQSEEDETKLSDGTIPGNRSDRRVALLVRTIRRRLSLKFGLPNPWSLISLDFGGGYCWILDAMKYHEISDCFE